VKLLKIDEKNLCVDFVRLGGNLKCFLEHFDDIKEELSGLLDNNALHP